VSDFSRRSKFPQSGRFLGEDALSGVHERTASARGVFDRVRAFLADHLDGLPKMVTKKMKGRSESELQKKNHKEVFNDGSVEI